MGRHLSQLARAADSLCDGDLVDRCIRSNQSWNLLPTAVSNRDTINIVSNVIIQLIISIGKCKFNISFFKVMGKGGQQKKYEHQVCIRN